MKIKAHFFFLSWSVNPAPRSVNNISIQPLQTNHQYVHLYMYSIVSHLICSTHLIFSLPFSIGVHFLWTVLLCQSKEGWCSVAVTSLNFIQSGTTTHWRHLELCSYYPSCHLNFNFTLSIISLWCTLPTQDVNLCNLVGNSSVPPYCVEGCLVHCWIPSQQSWVFFFAM